MPILISWIAFNNDFKNGLVDKGNSPNYIFHKLFYNHSKHVILSTNKPPVDDEPAGDLRMTHLISAITKDFPSHKIEQSYMDINDPIDLEEVKTKVESKLLEYSNTEIDIFFSPGTSIMQVVWFICHTNLNLKTRLFQMRPALKSKTGKQELLELTVEQSSIPVSAIIKEKSQNKNLIPTENNDNLLITKSLKPVYGFAYQIAQTDSVSSLIFGESGTGKELLAQYIHQHSIRRKQPFIAINCASLHDDLLESRLFGFKKGSFTNAYTDQEGLFEMANGGTIFLDEIGDISSYMQQSLLRVLQEKEITPIGGKTVKVDVRVIAATNKNLTDQCKKGLFRWDLYYRLAVVELELPSLRERGKDELQEMIYFLLQKKNEQFRRKLVLKISKDALEIILKYPFPGNVRELENLVEHLYVVCEKEATIENLPLRFIQLPSELSMKWGDIEKQHITKVLGFFEGNQRQAWLALGYGSLNTFKNKLKEYQILQVNDGS